MHRLTLTFKDSDLEQLYQSNQLKLLIFPIFLLMNVSTTIYMASLILWQLTEGIYNNIALNIATLALVILSTVIISKKRQSWAQYWLIILNHIFMAFQLTTNSQSDPQQIYIVAASSMMAQCINLFVCDFKLAAFNNCTLLIFRLALAATLAQSKYYQYILIIMVSIIIMFGLYKLNYNTRAYYLSTRRDSQWETLLPKVMSREFYLFQLNSEQMKFEVKKSNQLNRFEGYEQFYNFTRNSRVQNGETLETFIYKRAKLQLKSNERMVQKTFELQVEINGKKQHISYSEFFLSEMNFMIVLECEKVNQMMIQHSELNKRQIFNFNHFIRQSAKRLHKYVQLKDLVKISTLQIIFFEFQARLKLQTGCLQSQIVNLDVLMSKMIKYFPDLILTVNAEKHVEIRTIKPLFVLMIIHMFKVAKKNKIAISLNNYQSPELRIHGKFDNQALSEDKIFQSAVNIIVEQFDQQNNYYYFGLQQNFCFTGLQEVGLQLQNL